MGTAPFPPHSIGQSSSWSRSNAGQGSRAACAQKSCGHSADGVGTERPPPGLLVPHTLTPTEDKFLGLCPGHPQPAVGPASLRSP